MFGSGMAVSAEFAVLSRHYFVNILCCIIHSLCEFPSPAGSEPEPHLQVIHGAFRKTGSKPCSTLWVKKKSNYTVANVTKFIVMSNCVCVNQQAEEVAAS